MSHIELVADYLAGPELLCNAVAGMTDDQWDAKPIAGMWSCRQVVCHLADFEPVYADRMKRVIAESEPTFFGGDPEVFATRLAYEQRDLEVEIQIVESVRRQMGIILKTLSVEDFQRIGNHSEDGPLTLTTLLTNITQHLPHHLQFIAEKRAAM